MSNKPTTNDNIRDLIDARFDKLSDKIDVLSDRVSKNEVKEAVSSTKIGMLIVGISLVTSGIVTAILDMLRGKQ